MILFCVLYVVGILIWNIRGTKRKNALEKVKPFCNVNNISIMMLCETKFVSLPSDACIKRAGFSFCEASPSMGFAGGLWVLYKDNIYNSFKLIICFTSSGFIACPIELLASGIKFMAFLFMHLLKSKKNLSFGQNFLFMYLLFLSLSLFLVISTNLAPHMINLGELVSMLTSRLKRMANIVFELNVVELSLAWHSFSWRKKRTWQ